MEGRAQSTKETPMHRKINLAKLSAVLTSIIASLFVIMISLDHPHQAEHIQTVITMALHANGH
jgi:hypothetical protein